MSPTGRPQGQSLGGLWHGRYFYPMDRPPVAFTAVLDDADGWLSGTIEEVSEAGETLGAAVQGRRDGAHVRFLKTYDRPGRLRDSVAYEGALNGEATEIVGRWSIPGSWSGEFMMIRADATPQAEARRISERA
jgi:hypothetical protein